MRTMVLQQGRSPRGEKTALVERVLRAVARAYLELEQEQQGLIQDMAYSRQERQELASLLIETFLMNGLPHLEVSSEEIEQVLPGVDLIGFLYHLLGGSEPAQLIQDYKELYAKHHQHTTAPVSQVSPNDGPGGPGEHTRRTRRSGGRVGEHYRRAMPEPFLLT